MDSDHNDNTNDLEYLDDDDDYIDDCDYIDDDDERDETAYDAADESKNELQTYAILTELDIQRLALEDVSKLSSILSISRSWSSTLLCYYKWNVNRVHDDWFSNEKSIHDSVGLFERPIAKPPAGERLRCRICFEWCRINHTSAASCGHRFCNACWGQYIRTAIANGPGCLLLRCPAPSCPAAVGCDMVHGFASEEDEQRYARYLLGSYVEYRGTLKWCPAPGCDLAVSFVAGNAGKYDVRCGCNHSFCWNCIEEAHRPVPCETVAKWIQKNSSEGENTDWILAYTKPCPKCRRNIEKNDGCNHMSCTAPCGYEFCWLCLGPWEGHKGCNQYYKSGTDEDEMGEDRSIRARAKLSIERYTHYFERWATNHRSQQKAVADLACIKAEKLEELGDKQSMPATQLKFVTEAWEQIVECRRVLKWTYAYGYYLDDESPKKRLFEYLQGEAEAGLERLHGCAEKELNVHFCEQTTSKDFGKFGSKLRNLTVITRNYFENLVRALEDGL